MIANMSEITNENFEQMFPIIRDHIKHSSFIALDTEMTGLVYNKTCTPSLFDTLDKRYDKQRQSATNFIVCQMGLSLYSKNQNSNSYHTKTYTFYLCPRSLQYRKPTFAMDLSAIEFLAYNHFEFDKFAKNGINYLNEIEEQNLRDNFDDYMDIDFIECPFNYENSSHQLSEWLSNRLVDKNSGNQCVLKCRPTVNPLLNYAFLREFRKNFTTVWVEEINDRFVAKPIDANQRTQLLKAEHLEKERVIDRMVGFSRVFQCLVDARRPIVGHNMIMDLLLIYHHFYQPLPNKLKAFKTSLHSLFPYLFDTKCVIFNEKKDLSELSHIFKNSSLGDIYTKLLDDEIVNSYTNLPKIEQLDDQNHKAIEKYSPHNAGFDAFATAFVFVRVTSILMAKKDSSLVVDGIPNHSWFELLKTIEIHCNKINMIRANVHYMCISGADPSGSKSQWLFAKKRNKDSKFLISNLTSKLSEKGTADINVIDDHSVLIATNSHGMSKSILDAFRNDYDIKVSEYNVFKHNRNMRLFLWTAFTASSSFAAVMTFNLIKSFQH